MGITQKTKELAACMAAFLVLSACTGSGTQTEAGMRNTVLVHNISGDPHSPATLSALAPAAGDAVLPVPETAFRHCGTARSLTPDTLLGYGFDDARTRIGLRFADPYGNDGFAGALHRGVLLNVRYSFQPTADKNGTCLP